MFASPFARRGRGHLEGRKRVIFRIKSITPNVYWFYAKYEAYNYAPKVVYIEKKQLLCTFYAEKSILNAFSIEKHRERVENLSLMLRNLSVSFSNLSVTVARIHLCVDKMRPAVAEKLLFSSLNEPSRNVKIILHCGRKDCPIDREV